MSNDLNPVSSSSGSPMPPTGRTEQTQPLQPSKKVNQAEGESAYAGADTIGTGSSPVSQTLPIKNVSNIYDVYPDIPSLIAPNLAGEQGPLPYGSLEKKMIQKYYLDQAKLLLKESGASASDSAAVYRNLSDGISLPDPKLSVLSKEIKKKAEEKTREAGALPAGWTARSGSNQDWIPSLRGPYESDKRMKIDADYDKKAQALLADYVKKAEPPLSSSEVGLLEEAIVTGKVDGRIADRFVRISAEATDAVRKEYGLSRTWFKSTPLIEDWIPANLGIVTPAKLDKARAMQLMQNVTGFLEEYAAKVKKYGEYRNSANTGEEDPVSTATLLDAMMNAAIVGKNAAGYTQVVDAETSKELSDLKLEDTALKTALSEEQSEQNMKMANVERAMNILATTMKIIGPILGVAAVVATFATGGLLAAIPILLAGVAMMAYSLLDSKYGITQATMEYVNNAIAKLAPDSELAQAVIKVMGLAVMVAVFVAMFAAGKGIPAGTKMVGLTVKKVAAKIGSATMKMLSLQAAVIVILSSGAIPQLVGATAQTLGLDEKACKVLEGVALLLEMLALVGAMLFLIKPTPSAVPVEPIPSKSVQETVKEILKKIKNAPQSAKDSLTSWGEFFQSMLTKEFYSPDTLKQVIPGIKSMNPVQRLVTLTQMSPYIAQTISGAANTVLYGYAAKITADLGEIKAHDEFLTGQQTALSTLMDNLANSIDMHGEAASEIQRAWSDFLNSFKNMMDLAIGRG